jgi:hypothetical protein
MFILKYSRLCKQFNYESSFLNDMNFCVLNIYFSSFLRFECAINLVN